MDWSKLLELAPLAVGAAKPGSPEATAFMRGYQESMQKIQQQQMQQRGMDSDQRYRDAQIANMEQDNQFRQQQFQHTSETQAQQAALERLSLASRAFQPAIEGVAETAMDATGAENELIRRGASLETAFGVPSGALTAQMPSMTPIVSSRKKKLAQQLYERAKKTYGAEAMAGDSITLQTGEAFGDVKPSQLRALFEAGAVTDAGQPATPYVKPVNNPKQYQSKEMLRGGKRVVVNFDPDTATYTDLQGQAVSDVEPIPPVSAQTQPGGLPPRTQSRVDAKAKGFDTQPIVRTTQKMAEAVSFANSLDVNSTNPADDQALIYAFAKAMDPDSVVREGEYATVQKYAQQWAANFGFNAARIFSNTQFLTAQARLNMKSTIQKKYAAAKTQYDNVRKSYAAQIDKITGQPGSGEDWLVDYGAAFPTEALTAPNGTRPGATIGAPTYEDYINRRRQGPPL